jgi:hypothetical protein
MMLADSGEIVSQTPEPRSVSGDGLYTLWEGYETRGVLQYTGKQVDHRICPPPPYRMWLQLQKTL